MTSTSGGAVAAGADDIDVAIIGAGAAGLAAAIFAAERAAELGRAVRIAVFDGAPKLGAKILISGGGRCNVTNVRVTADDFNGPRPTIRNVLATFDADAAVRWFADLGVALKAEPGGKRFPTTDRAATVLDALVARAAARGVDVRTRARVDAIEPVLAPGPPAGGAGAEGGGAAGRAPHAVAGYDADAAFDLAVGPDIVRARRVVLATGGRSLPRTGSDGGGYALAARLGHTVTPTFPALVPLVLAADFFHAELSGVSHPAELTTTAGGKVVDRRAGSLLWTHFGVSGPVVLDASRHWLAARLAVGAAELRLSLLPGRDAAGADAWLAEAAHQDGRRPVGAVVAGAVPERVARRLCAVAGVDPAMRLAELARPARRALAEALGALALPVVGDRGWDFAEVTAGGVPLAEVDHRTMASRRAPGLHLAGEVLDVDGRIGGFNFHWAWATGRLAGRGAVAGLGRHD